MGVTAGTPGKRGAFAGWDHSDTVRVVMVAGMVWLTLEAPATTTFGQPISGIALAAYYAALASALFSPQFWTRFGRPRVVAPETEILPGDRLFQAVTLLGLLAATPQTIFWAIETPVSKPWSLGFYWFCVALFVLAAVVCLRNLLRSNALIHLDASGIAAPRLWRSAIPWNAFSGARRIGGKSDSALMLQFAAPTPVELMKRPWLDWSVRLGTEKRSLTIPGLLLGMPAEKIATILEDRIRAHAPQSLGQPGGDVVSDVGLDHPVGGRFQVRPGVEHHGLAGQAYPGHRDPAARAQGPSVTAGDRALQSAQRVEGGRPADAVGRQAQSTLQFAQRRLGGRAEDPVHRAGVHPEDDHPFL